MVITPKLFIYIYNVKILTHITNISWVLKYKIYYTDNTFLQGSSCLQKISQINVK